jgi:hypothetical protein
VTALKNSPRTRQVSLATGGSLVAYAGYRFVSVTGWGLWLVMSAALLALAIPLVAKKGDERA